MSKASLGEGVALHDTGKALKVECVDLGSTIWIPHSVLHEDSEVFDADDNAEGEVFVKSWWAEKEGHV